MIVESIYLDGIELEAYDVMQNPCKFYQEVTESLSISIPLIGCFKEYVGLPNDPRRGFMEGGFPGSSGGIRESGITQTRARELPGYDAYLISVSGVWVP